MTVRIAVLVALMTVTPAKTSYSGPKSDLLSKGKDALAASMYEKAIKLFTEFIGQEPDNAEAYYCRAVAYEKNTEFDLALSDLNQSLRRDPHNAKAWSLRGSVNFYKSQFAKAESDFGQAIKLNPLDANAYFVRGLARFEARNIDGALADNASAIRIEPKRISSYCQLANILSSYKVDKFRDGKKAIQLATEACKVSEWKVYFAIESLAAAYAETGEYEKATKWQKEAIELVPKAQRLRTAAERRLKLYQDHKPFRFSSGIEWSTGGSRQPKDD